MQALHKSLFELLDRACRPRSLSSDCLDDGEKVLLSDAMFLARGNEDVLAPASGP